MSHFCWSAVKQNWKISWGACRRERDKASSSKTISRCFSALVSSLGSWCFILSLDQFVDQAGRVVETDSVPLPTRGKGEAGRDVALPEAGIAPPGGIDSALSR